MRVAVKAALITAAAGICAAIITASVLLFNGSRGGAGESNKSSKNKVGDHAGCVAIGNSGSVNCNTDPTDSAGVDPQTTLPPQGGGPWAFRVVNTVVDGTDKGLVVRSCNRATCECTGANCERLGVAPDDALIWAICQAVSDFNGNDTSNTWLKIKWPNDKPAGFQVFTSSKNDPHAGWVLAKYTVAAGTNGNIPVCS